MKDFNEKKYKYIHLLWANEYKFNGPLVRMINNQDNGFSIEEHCFITPHRQVYQKLRVEEGHFNVYLDENNKNLFRQYNDYCSWFISHGYPDNKVAFRLGKKLKGKIVYRYWGGRRYPHTMIAGQPIKNVYRKIMNSSYNCMFKWKYGGLAVIGIANNVDVIDLSPFLPDAVFYKMPYMGSREESELIRSLKNSPKMHKDIINILIGHRSDPIEKHIAYLKQLDKFDKSKFHVYMPMSYGDAEYAIKVKNYVEAVGLSNVTIIDKMMDSAEYIRFLDTIDIALIDCENSCALGNICLLLALRKTLYISRNGVIKKAFDIEGIPCRCLDELATMEWRDFSSLLSLDNIEKCSLLGNGFDAGITCWKDLFEYLSNK